MNYHNVIIDLLHYILTQPDEYLARLDSGNAYDKIIRNYHQFNNNGEKVYRNKKRIIKHYRFTVDAWKLKDDKSKLYYEHLIPLKITKSDLLNSDKTKEEIAKILNKNEIVVLTKKESKELDKKYKSTMPDNGMNRIEIMNYKIAKESKDNSIFNI